MMDQCNVFKGVALESDSFGDKYCRQRHWEIRFRNVSRNIESSEIMRKFRVSLVSSRYNLSIQNGPSAD